LIKTKILLVEDDELASELIYTFLTEANFKVKPVFTAIECTTQLQYENYDLVILDINLPDFDGFEVLKSIRTKISAPIIITSAYSDTKSKILSFKYGASDYMVKPLEFEELEARIWVQLSKNSEINISPKKQIFEIKDSSICFKQQVLNLTTIEFEILSLLIKNKNLVIKREELVSTLSTISATRSLDNHIKNIRKKLNDTTNYLKTEYGVGYMLQF